VSDRRDLAEHLRYYAEIGVEGISRERTWRRRAGDDPGWQDSRDESPAGDAAAVEAQGNNAAPPPALDAIRERMGDCTRCKLHSGRTNIVFGVGNPRAKLMFVGEGPGADEDEQGEPFVGRAGQLLTQIIKAMGYARQDVYIANVVKCRPPNNRNPEPDEVATCQPFLLEQIDAISPSVIVALGKFAAQTLLQTETPISRLRGRFHSLRGIDVMPTFHPSYLLRNPGAKREVWEDMKQVMRRLTNDD
jgi:uracil-DNA glycosylase